ncbi:DUF2294 domain-containing protein [Pleurocapsales cyanobacterium LEGE 06147]|nr:DUF2294 domain-containing protein [Pleurocapsales cyanobacterium LEGE 06147]
MSKISIATEQLEKILSPKIKSIYKKQLEHQLSNISYRLFERTLVVILEGTVTPPEQLLKQSNCQQLAEQVRRAIDRIIQPQIKTTIEEAMNVKVIDFLSDTTIDTNRTAAIAIFEFHPKTDSDEK